MRMNYKFFIGLAVLSLGVTACHDDVSFDQKTYDDLINQAFPIQNVDPQHNWATMGTATASISVKKEAGQNYKVKLYDSNPIGNNTNLTLLAEGYVADGATISLPFSYKLSRPYAFVTLIDDDNYMSTYPCEIANGKLTANIGTSQPNRAARRAVQTPKEGTFHDTNPIEKPTLDKTYSNTVPTNAKYARDYQNYQNGDVIYINSDYQQLNNPQNFENLTIYVDGNVTYVGDTKQDATKGTVFCVTEGSTLKLGYVQTHLTVYLAPNATLDISEGLMNNVIRWWPYEAEIVKSGNNSFTFQNSHGFIYMSEGSTVKATDLSLVGDAKIYNGGGTITATNLTVDGSTLWNEGTIKVSEKLTLKNNSPGLYIATNNSIKAKTVEIDNSLLYNMGSVAVSEALTMKNDNGEIINNGDLSAGSLSMDCSKMHNVGDVTISEASTFKNAQTTWQNDGTFTTGSFSCDTDRNLYNNCHLIVNGEFGVKQSTFYLGSNASIVTQTMTWELNPDMYMDSNSLLKVTDRLLTKNFNSGYGFRGVGDSYAIIQAGEIAMENPDQFRMSYFGKIHVATDKHFAQGYMYGNVSQPYYYLDTEGGADLVGYNKAKVAISDEGCGAAYTGEPIEEEPIAKTFSYRYCFEDNFPDAGDYDFNDVVMTLTPTVSGKTVTIKVSLDAVGATKTIGAALRLVGVNFDDLERHSVTQGFASPDGQGLGEYTNIDTGETFLNGSQAPNNTSSMVIVLFKDAHWAINPVKGNTGGVQNLFYNTVKRDVASNKDYVDAKTAIYTLVFNDEAKAKTMLEEINYDLFIVEPYNGSYWEVHTIGFKTAQVVTPIKPEGYETSYGSKMPWAIKVPGDFKYPIEWQVIGWNKGGENKGAYNEPGHSFAEWAENSSTATDWYDHPTSGLVFE